MVGNSVNQQGDGGLRCLEIHYIPDNSYNAQRSEKISIEWEILYGLAPTLDNLLDLKKEVAVDKADVVSCGFLTNKKVESVLGKLMDSQGQRSADDDSDAVCTGGPHH